MKLGSETNGQKTTETTGNKDKTANMPAQSVQKNDNEKDTKKAWTKTGMRLIFSILLERVLSLTEC